MDHVQDHKLVQELLDFSTAGLDSDQQSTSAASVHSSHDQHVNQQNPGETEWAAILWKLDQEASPISAARMIMDDHLQPSSAAVQNPTDEQQIHTPHHVPICTSLMSSFGDMNPEQHSTESANNGVDNQQLEATLERRLNSSAAQYIDPRLSTSNTSASTPDNSHLDSVLDELLISYNDHYSGTAQQSEEDHRHSQYQNQQSFNGTSTSFPHMSSAADHHDASADYHHEYPPSHCNNAQLQGSNSATYYNYNHMINYVESGSCTPATSASSDEPVDMKENLSNQPQLINMTNSTDQSSSLTIITEDHSQQKAKADPGAELLDKKRSGKTTSRVKKPKKHRDSKLAIRMTSDTDIVDDGFKWRKYGQKAVKNSPYPRSYYKCTDKRCNVKKHVERQRNEPDVVITTYEGVHTHATPSSNHPNNESDSNAPIDLAHLYPPSQPDHPHSLHRPISHYAYLNPLIAHHLASIYNNSYNYRPPHLSSLPFPLIHPTHDTLDYQLKHHLLQLLMRDQDMAIRSHSI